jgi:hypothetical protein
MRRNAAGAIAAGACAMIVGLVIVVGGNMGGWVVVAIGATAVLLVTMPPLVVGQRRNQP